MFDLDKLLRKNIKSLKAYSSARNEFQGTASVFLDANENPYESGINRYPDPLQQKLKIKIEKIKHISPEKIFLGNGSDEAIDLLIRAFCEPGIDNILSINPTYGMYKVCADINNVEYRDVLLNPDFSLNVQALLNAVDPSTKLIFLCSPNNPSGNSLNKDDIIKVITSFNGLVILDEAYIDFSSQKSLLEEIDNYSNLVILQTFSKAWGMAGIRLGMAFASEPVINILNKIKYPYNVNILTQEKALECLNNSEIMMKSNVAEIIRERDKLFSELKNISVIQKLYSTDSNFILAKVEDAKATYNYLCSKEIIVRDRSKVALCNNCLRLTIGTPEENKTLLEALKQI